MATLNQIINARAAAWFSGCAFLHLSRINRTCWEGSCAEIFSALEGDDAHVVYRASDGARVIYRAGAVAPHFVQAGHTFLCPFWSRG